tara:strand:+ start:2125 stop:4398 length:2274 start_codon:yes stop_codon:yes gene_type:complete
MPLTKLAFQPGINRESTAYGSEGGWYNSNLIRFRKGFPEKMGGWSKLSGATYQGVGRSLHVWSALDGANYMGLGTDSKMYLERGGAFFDITPIRRSVTLSANPLTTGSSGSGVVTVTDSGHGALNGDFVTLSGAATVDGVTAAQINTEHEITFVSVNSYTIDTGGSATSGSTAGGGSSVLAQYQINVGLDVFVGGVGFGAAVFGGVTSSFTMTTLNGDITDSATSIILTSASDFETAADTIDGALDVNSSSITLDDSSGFPSIGTVLIGSEKIRYGTNASNILGDLTRGTDGTTTAAHSDGAAVTFVGLILIDNELIQYTGKSSNTLDAGVVRGVRGTTAAAHSDGADVKEANDFIPWGGASSITADTGLQLRLWSQDNWGEDLAFSVFDGAPYYWDKTLGEGARGVTLASVSGSSDAPTITRQILVSTTDRHLICLGCNPLGETAQDLLQIRWSDQEAPFDWTPTATNTSGSQRLSTGSEIITAKKTRQETLIWTDTSLYSMRFTGPPFTFGFALVSNNVSVISPNAAAVIGDKVFWMDRENFYAYTGRLQVVPCTVLRYVFDDINLDQSRKFFAASNRMFDEVFFFYASSSATEIDRYVKFNYTGNIWDIGTLSRTAWVDFGVQSNPRGTGTSDSTKVIYVHEDTENDDGSAMDSFIESADFDIGDGNQFQFINKIIPDLVLTGTDAEVDYIIKTRNYPNDSLATEATATVSASTQKSDVRCRGRTATLRVASSTVDTAWTLGHTRLDIRPDGRR